jgi:hypothetical protein
MGPFRYRPCLAVEWPRPNLTQITFYSGAAAAESLRASMRCTARIGVQHFFTLPLKAAGQYG